MRACMKYTTHQWIQRLQWACKYTTAVESATPHPFRPFSCQLLLDPHHVAIYSILSDTQRRAETKGGTQAPGFFGAKLLQAAMPRRLFPPARSPQQFSVQKQSLPVNPVALSCAAGLCHDNQIIKSTRLYVVAMSCVGSPTGVHMLITHLQPEGADAGEVYADSVVYKEVLRAVWQSEIATFAASVW
eukprot:357286-Chlamydomonas_euryale.AAC.11